MTTRDGVTLLADVYLPSADGPHPALLQRTPYSRDRAVVVDGAIGVRAAVAAGWAVVIQDVRGRGGSDGRFEPLVHEATDGFDAVEWVGSQDWCDGQVAMYGRSYAGLAQWLAAAAQPRALRAISPMMAGSDAGRNWFGVGSAFEHGFVTSWVLTSLAAADLLRSGDREAQDRLAMLLADPEAWRIRLSADDVSVLGRSLSYVRDWLGHPRELRRWLADDRLLVDLAAVEVPVMMTGGWYDFGVGGVLDTYLALRQVAARPPTLVVGPWSHGSFTGSYSEFDFGPSAGLEGSGHAARQLAWLDQHVHPEAIAGAADEGGAILFDTGDRTWIGADPDVLTAPTNVLLRRGAGLSSVDRRVQGTHEGGSHAEAADADVSEPLELRIDPAAPVPTLGGPVYLPGRLERSGPRDQGALVPRPDVVTLVADELGSATRLLGRAVVHVEVSTPLAGLRLVARLCVRRELPSEQHTTMLLREAAAVVERAGTSEVDVDLGVVLHHLGDGERLVLLLAATSAPRFGSAPVELTATGPAEEACQTPDARPAQSSDEVLRPALGRVRLALTTETGADLAGEQA